jgi:hypothetical protein
MSLSRRPKMAATMQSRHPVRRGAAPALLLAVLCGALAIPPAPEERTATPGRALQKKQFVPDVAPVMRPGDHFRAGQLNPGARPLGQLNDHHRGSAALSGGQGAGPTGARVAIIIVGLLRQFLEPQVQSTQHFLTDTLAAEYGAIDLFICVDSPNAARLRTLSVGRVAARQVFEHKFDGRHNQWPRMAACLADVQRAAGADWAGYEWVVRSRPDNVFFAPVPPLKPLRTDTVYTRARRFGVSQLSFRLSACLPLPAARARAQPQR